MLLTFLAAPERLTKTISRTKNELRIQPYPHSALFTSFTEEINTLQELEKHIYYHANAGHCLLKGELQHPLVNQSRAGSTTADTATQLVVIDIDRSDATDVESFIRECLPVEFHDTSYIWQHSASAGITKMSLCGHLFFINDTPLNPKLLKQYLTGLNFYNDSNKNNTHLTKTKMGLSYGIDPTVAQNDKLIFISPPELIGISDPFPHRLTRTTKHRDTLHLNFAALDYAKLNSAIQNHIETLRKTEGLPKRTPKLKLEDGEYVLTNPERAIFRGPYLDTRGFRYGNLNNGDSYAYYHTLKDPKYLHNFKGEPIVHLRDIDPDYWQEWNRGQSKPNARYTAFRDVLTDTYYTVEDGPNGVVAHTVSTLDKALSYLALNRQPIPENLPLWHVFFDPTTTKTIDYENQTLNTFTPSEYLKNARPSTVCPPKIAELILHVVGGCLESARTLLNWLAHIVQRRTKAQTAFVLHGTTGTGKGALMNYVLRPILGHQHARSILMDTFDSAFNEWADNALLIMVDEAKMNDQKQAGRTRLNTIKHHVTEPIIELRRKFKTAITANSYTSFIFASNERDSIILTEDDRRFHIPPRQETSIGYTPQDINELSAPATLQAFTDYLTGITVDDTLLHTPAMTDAKRDLIDASKDDIDEFLDILATGDFDRIAEHADAPETHRNQIFRGRYLELIDTWQRCLGQTCHVTANDLRSVFNFVFAREIGPQKFAKMLANKNFKTKNKKLDKYRVARCAAITWRSACLAASAEGGPAEGNPAEKNIFMDGRTLN